MALVSLGVMRMPLAPALTMFSMRRDLALVVAVLRAGAGQQLGAQLVGLRLRAFLHLDEEGVGLGLGDEADDDRPAGSSSGRRRGRRRRRRSAAGAAEPPVGAAPPQAASSITIRNSGMISLYDMVFFSS